MSSALQGTSLWANGPTQASPGHRPGFPIKTVRALKGRNIGAQSAVPPLQGFSAPPYGPKALPWAGLGWAFGPQADAVRTVHDPASSLLKNGFSTVGATGL